MINPYVNTLGTAPRSIHKSVRVATHLTPVQFCIENFNLTGVVEHGMGLGSTPYFHSVSTLTYLLSYENEARWSHCPTCDASDGGGLIHQILPWTTPDEFVASVRSLPMKLESQVLGFVDGPGPERIPALRELSRLRVSALIYHDAETLTLAEREEIQACVPEYSIFQYIGENPETLVCLRNNIEIPDLGSHYVTW